MCYVAGSILSISSFFGPSSRFLPCCMVYTDGPILKIFPLPKHSSPLQNTANQEIKHRESLFSSCKWHGEKLQPFLKTCWTMNVLIYICSDQFSKKPQNKTKKKKEKTLLGSVGSRECKYKHVRGNSTVNFIFSAQITSLKCISVTNSSDNLSSHVSHGPPSFGEGEGGQNIYWERTYRKRSRTTGFRCDGVPLHQQC